MKQQKSKYKCIHCGREYSTWRIFCQKCGANYSIQHFHEEDEIQTCRVCGCTDDNCIQCIKKTGMPCYWVEEDLCSACCEEIQATRAFNLDHNTRFMINDLRVKIKYAELPEGTKLIAALNALDIISKLPEDKLQKKLKLFDKELAEMLDTKEQNNA